MNAFIFFIGAVIAIVGIGLIYIPAALFLLGVSLMLLAYRLEKADAATTPATEVA